MKYPKGPQKQPKALNLVWMITAGLLVLAGGLYLDYDRERFSTPTAWLQGPKSAAAVEEADAANKAEESKNKIPSDIYLHGELAAGQFYEIRDEAGKILDNTNRMVRTEDEIILANNQRYKVTSVDYKERQVVCSYVGLEDIQYLKAWDTAPVAKMDNEDVKIGIYMTHTDESYVPTEGTESIAGKGGIVKVAQRLGDILQRRGANVKISDNTHDPHDANAYHRSRKTAVQLLKGNPDVMFDVHRDGVEDPGFYEVTQDGKQMTSIRMVVGKQNPHMDANLTFAKEIKAYFDKHYPGMIKGIYMGKGNYNQDLGPRMVLLEVGTHTNSREEAEEGVAVFADGVSKYLKVSTGTQTGAGKPEEEVTKVDNSSGSTAAILALVAVGGGLIFLFISRGTGVKN